MTDSETDAGESLLQRAKAGDLVAFEQIVIQHERQVLATAFGLLGNWEDAQDSAQEVFVRVHKYLGSFDQTRDFAPWLYRTTVNVCRDQRRRRHPEAPLEETSEDVADPAAGPDRHTHTAEARRILLDALRRLPEKERAAIVLRDLENLPTNEVARILGSTEATVRSQISSARLKIMKWTERFRREQP